VSGQSPRATRLGSPRWVDTRLVLGVLLVLLAVVIGARVFASADHYSQVYVARQALVPGEHVTASDLEVGRVRFAGQAARYVAANGAAPVGYVVTRYVGPHELVPRGALAARAAGGAGDRDVTVPVQPGHLPDDLAHGDLVDVYATAKVATGAPVPPPSLVIAGVPVDAYQGGSRGIADTSSVAVVLAVPDARVVTVVHALETGTIDLVRVPDPAASGAP